MAGDNTLIVTTRTGVRPLGVRGEPLHNAAGQLRRVLQRRLGEQAADLLFFSGQYRNYVLGDFAGAKPLLVRSLAICARVFGPDHLSTAHCLNDLGVAYSFAGDHAAAKPLQERALAIREKALGPEHPYTAQSLCNLAEALVGLGEYAAARPLAERAAAAHEKALGPEHRTTATTPPRVSKKPKARQTPTVALSLVTSMAFKTPSVNAVTWAEMAPGWRSVV